MNALSGMQRWRTCAAIMMWNHGWIWLVSAALLIATYASHYYLLVPSAIALEQAQFDLDLGRKRASQLRTASPPKPQDTEQQRLKTIRQTLNNAGEAVELTRQMAALAQAQGIVLAQSDYQQQINNQTGLVQVQISQPVRATYPQLRHYIETVLAKLPNASLDQIMAKRENAGQAQLDARLKWSFWLVPKPIKGATP